MREPAFYLGNPVLSLQTMLRLISDADPRVLPLIPDGFYGVNTIAAVRSFQEAYALPVTGQTDRTTWRTVVAAYDRLLPSFLPPCIQPLWFPEQSVSPGESNLHLYLVQAMLTVLSRSDPDFSSPQLTGVLDDVTLRGLQQIQRAAALPDNGVLDSNTWHALTGLYRTVAGTGIVSA